MVGMEAAVVSAAITGMLKIVGNKLASLIIREYSSIVGVKKDLQELQDLVQEINCNLERAGYRNSKDVPWLKKLKEVVYDIEDIVNEFQLKAEKHEIDGDGGFMSKCLLTKTAESLVLQCRAAKNIKKIKKRFAKIVKQRNDLAAIFGHAPVNHINKSAVSMQTLPICDEASVLGRDQEMHQIISNLVETNDKENIKIVSIVGLGGSGKTTLAKLIFNDSDIIQKHFDVRLWVHVSQDFDYENFIKKLFEAFADKDPGMHPLPYMSKRIVKGLTRKKFLIVMDDVWTESQIQWDKIMEYLKAGAPGSGVLLTTRSANVAEVARSTYQFCLQCLSPNDSWQLFQQSYRMPAKLLESDFIKVGKEIVETCCGLPLAIKVLAGSLGGKELIGEWQATRDMLLDVEGEESVSACLKLSYFHLPSDLKQCFTMCSLFPKGHLIDKQKLVDQWIAHDMISLTPGFDDLEHIGHRYFNSLVQVFFLEVEDEDNDGTASYKMHDLIHDLAQSILREENSTIVPEDATSSTKGYKYFSPIEPRKLFFENARAIYVDEGLDSIDIGSRGSNPSRFIKEKKDKIFGNTVKSAKRLRSIIIENSILSRPMLTAIFRVKYLKYLEMCKVRFEALPEAITDIWSLQALYIQSSDLLELPESIGKLKRLRTLNLSRCSELKSIPDSIGDCQRLRVLRLVSTRIHGLPSGITTLQNIQYLEIDRCFSLVGLPEGIWNLTKLKALDRFCVGSDKKYARISELATLSRISGKLEICFLCDLIDPCEAHQACLKQKENLHELKLSWGSRHGSENNPEGEVVALDGLEPPSGIKRIKISMYAGGRLASWMLKQARGGVQSHGQFPFLTKMSLENFPKLKHLDGLVQLPCLEELHLNGMPALESISGGPYPSLAKVTLERLGSLGEVWIGKEGEGCSNHNPHQSEQLQIGSCLTDLLIERCPNLVVKPHFPISLEHLWLHSCNSNLLLPSCQGQGSAPYFSHLKVFELRDIEASSSLSPPLSPGLRSGFRLEMLQHMTALESLEIFLCSDLTELPEYLGNLSSLQRMTIIRCDRLRGLPQSIGQLTSLEELIINECCELVQFPESLGELRSLRSLAIYYLPVLSLPKSLCHLTSLKELRIKGCGALVQLPEDLGELCSLSEFYISHLQLTCLPQSLCRLMSLQELHIEWCRALGERPEWLGQLNSLHELTLKRLDGMTCLPQSLCRLDSSLKVLRIIHCRGLTSLPEWIKGLTALQTLDIEYCPNLERRCEEGTGEDWHLISHIPMLLIGMPLDDGPACFL